MFIEIQYFNAYLFLLANENMDWRNPAPELEQGSLDTREPRRRTNSPVVEA